MKVLNARRFLLKNLNSRGIYIISILTIICGLAPSIESILLKYVIDLVDNFEADTFRSSMLSFGIIYFVFWESLNLIWRLYDFAYLKSIPTMKAKIVDDLYNFIQFHSHKFFQDNLAGSLVNKINDVSKSVEMIFFIGTEIVRSNITFIAAIFTICSVSNKLGIAMILWYVFFVGTNILFRKSVNAKALESSNAKSTIVGRLIDMIINITSVRMFSNFKHEYKKIQEVTEYTADKERDLHWYLLKIRYFQGLSCSILIFSVLYILTDLRMSNQVTVGDFGLVLSLVANTVIEIWHMIQHIGDFFEEIGSYNQINTLISEHKIKDVKDAKDLQVHSGEIVFDKISFSYDGYKKVFDNKSIIIQGKQKVGLVGLSGSGKSTFANLITRLYDLESGNILIDAQDISLVTQKSLRRNISIIPQEPILFDRTIYENIAYGNLRASVEEVYAAAKLAHIHEDIMSMQNQYNTLCGERGKNLSGGQRQRVAIARAFLKAAPILILDEATSALDNKTQKMIQDSLSELCIGKTVIVIAHRLTMLPSLDRILVFDKGLIIEDGTHNELLDGDTFYSKLFNIQKF